MKPLNIEVTSEGGRGKEPWYKSRRIWSAAFSGVALTLTLLYPEQHDLIVHACVVVAGSLGLTSWVKPKK